MKIEDLKNIGDRCPFCNGANEIKNGLMCDGCLSIIGFYHQEITAFKISIDGHRFICIGHDNHFYFYIYDVSSRTEYFKHYLEDLNSIDDLVNMRNRILDNLILE